MPPKPNELEREKLFVLLILSFGTKFIPSQSEDGFVRFNVGGITPSFNDKIEKIDSIAPEAPSR